VLHVEGDRCPVGEIDGKVTDRVKSVEALLVKAGLKSRVLTDIRSEIWLKALGTLSFNPISALTHATMSEICRLPETRQLVGRMMREGQSVAEELGISLRHTIDKRIEGAEAVGRHKTSMLQDVETGRPLEIEALIGAIIEMGALTATPTPMIESVYALTKLLDKQIEAQGGFAGSSGASLGS
jgi:2-dehydropantoate 2-reductase